jgi:hypothetical protein
MRLVPIPGDVWRPRISVLSGIPMSTHATRDFLARNGAKAVTIPHRSNRAVIFDSDLFHETDTIRFKDGYLNRRINVTMLFGQRERNPTS